MATLYLVATPIGNLEDITLRALRVLKEVALIAAEDTRTTRRLLNYYDIKTRCTSYHDHNSKTKTTMLLETLKTQDVALVSEAGMPGISDPGQELVLAATSAGVQVIPIPGASAVTASLALSGLPPDGALVLGFLPRRKRDRLRLLESLVSHPYTTLVFEAPHRLGDSLQDMIAVLGNREIIVCRELTKVHEEVFRGDISEAIEHFTTPKGEFTILIAGSVQTPGSVNTDWARDELQRLKDQGYKAKESVSAVVLATGLSRKVAYRMWLDVRSP